MAIGIKVKKADEPCDLAASKFFGTPTIRLIPSDKVQELLAARQKTDAR